MSNTELLEEEQIIDGDQPEEGEEVEEQEEPLEPEEPEQPEQPDEPSSLARMEEIGDKLDRENGRHEKRVREIMGEDFEMLQPCPACQVPGYVFPYQPENPDDLMRHAMVDTYFGAAEPEYKPSTDVQGCPDCDGYGIVRTGGKNPQQLTKNCAFCNGNGWVMNSTIEMRTNAQAAPQPAAFVYPPTSTSSAGLGANNGAMETAPIGWEMSDKAGADTWGRWPGHSRYGIDPAHNGGVW